MASSYALLRVGFVSASFTACSLFTNLDSLGGDSGAEDATGQDATGQDAIGQDASLDGPVNLILNPGFEIAATGCGPDWVGGASETLVDAAHSGSHSCLVCGLPGQMTFVASPLGPSVPAAGASYYTEAYFQSPDGGQPFSSGSLTLIMILADGGSVSRAGGQVPVTASTWTVASGTIPVVRSDIVSLKYGIVLYNDAGASTACAYVDDVKLYEQ